MQADEPYKEIVITGDYKNFNDFYEDNKLNVYKSIVETFNGFRDIKNEQLILRVVSKLKKFEWETEFIFDRNNYEILKRDILPFFEKIEDYETCQEINQLHNLLTI